MKRVIITGAGGYLGSAVISKLLENTDSEIYAITSRAEVLREKYRRETRVVCCENKCIHTQDIPKADVLLHLAFARRFSLDCEIAQSIAFSRQVFEAAKVNQIPSLVYVSSQGVYGNTPELRSVETTNIDPSGLYTLAKYAAEELLWAVFSENKTTKCTVVRLDSIAGNQKMLPAFVASAIEKHAIHVVGGSQIFSFMDVRDAASGLVALIKSDSGKWKPVYNLGPNDRRFTIMQLAQLTGRVIEKRGFGKVAISLEKKDVCQFAGMDSSSFMLDTGWIPQYNMEDIISKLCDEYLEKKGLLSFSK